MNKRKTIAETAAQIEACRDRCTRQGVPFHADALASALGVSYTTLTRWAVGDGAPVRLAELLTGTLQECTASVVEHAMSADPKQQGWYMWYLRNRAGFSDKAGDQPAEPQPTLTFIEPVSG